MTIIGWYSEFLVSRYTNTVLYFPNWVHNFGFAFCGVILQRKKDHSKLFSLGGKFLYNFMNSTHDLDEKS